MFCQHLFIKKLKKVDFLSTFLYNEIRRVVYNMTIGQRIKQRREELNITQDELAKRLGYKSRSSINKIELDIYNLKQSKIKAIADALQTTPGFIMGWQEDEQTEKPMTLAAHFDGEEYTEEEIEEILQFVEFVKNKRK